VADVLPALVDRSTNSYERDKNVSFASLGKHPTQTHSPRRGKESSDITRDVGIQSKMMMILSC
jgi:hypothetical protein